MNNDKTDPRKVRMKKATQMDLSHTCRPITTLPGYYAYTQTGEIIGPAGVVLRTRWVRSAHRWYLHVRIRRKSRRVHRLVMAAHLGRPLALHEHVRHLDGDPGHNNALVNLALGTARDNARDKIAHNTNGRTLRNNDVREIRHLVPRLGARAVARRYGVTPGHVRMIASGRRWAGLAA